MLIPRPTHNDYLYETPVAASTPTGDTTKHCAWVKWFFEQPPWTCHVCGAKIVFSCNYCVCCRFGPHKRHTPRAD